MGYRIRNPTPTTDPTLTNREHTPQLYSYHSPYQPCMPYTPPPYTPALLLPLSLNPTPTPNPHRQRRGQPWLMLRHMR